MIIGICGKSGSGKSTLAKQLMNKMPNSVYLEIDKVGHKVLLFEEVKKDLLKHFNNILTDNKIDRKKLNKYVFSSKENMDILTCITWKYMQQEIDKFISNNKNKIIILDWLLLPNSKYFGMCDYKILLDIPYEVRKERAVLRDNISSEAFMERDNSSIEYNENDFDYVFKDNLDIEKRMVLV